MDIKSLSREFDVRALTDKDISRIYHLCKENEIYYKHHPPFVSEDSIKADMVVLPPNKEKKDKYYIGFFEKDTLVAIMDLVMGYPDADIAYIGFFMLNKNYQNVGLGSKIIAECIESLRNYKMKKIRLGVDKGNTQSTNFWQKNGFHKISENEYIIMELVIPLL